MALLSIIFLFLLFVAQGMVAGLDLSWIPADGDGPLPLSASYRASLRKLCAMIEGNDGSPLSPELEAKRGALSVMCKKLAASDAHTDSDSAPTNTRSALYGIVGLGLIGGSYYLWTSRGSAFTSAFSSGRTLGSSPATASSGADAVREARLKKFS